MPRRWRTAPRRDPRAGARRGGGVLVAAAAGLAVTVLAACGAATGSKGPTPVRACGTARTAVGVPVVVQVVRGTASCATARRVENAYAAMIRSGEVTGTGGGAPVRVRGWTCQGFPTTEVLRTGRASACRTGHAEVLAVLPNPAPPQRPTAAPHDAAAAAPADPAATAPAFTASSGSAAGRDGG